MARGRDIVHVDDEADYGYAMSSCTECRRRMPANKLHFFTVEVESGRRRGRSSSTYYGKRISTRSGGSLSTYYKNVSKRMCNQCHGAYQDRLAREAKQKLLIGIAVAILLLFVWLKPSGHNSGSQSASIQSTLNDPSSPVHYVDAPTSITEGVPTSSPPPPPQGFQALSQQPSSQEPAPTSPITPPLPQPEDYFVVDYLANVRSAPNNGPIVGQVTAGEQVSVVEIKGAWAKVRRGDEIIGWMHRSLLSRPR